MFARCVLVACGSFNPITVMHVKMLIQAKEALEKLGHRVLKGIISPTNDQYEKPGLACAAHRLAMVELAIQDFTRQGKIHPPGWIVLDRWESDQPQWTPTVDLLRRIESTENQSSGADHTKVRFVCGADLIETFARPGLWDDSHVTEICSRFAPVIFPRPGHDAHRFVQEGVKSALLKPLKSHLHFMDAEEEDISSTSVRSRVARRESTDDMVTPSVTAYIEQHHLYQDKS